MSGLGYLPDPVQDKPDWDAQELLGSVRLTPSEADNSDLVPSLVNQGGLGSCTANAAGYAIRASMLLLGMVNPEFVSRLFLYYLARATHGATGMDTGTWLRAIFEVANKFGFCPESVWSYTDQTADDAPGVPAKPFRLPSHKAFRAAYDQHQPTEYRRIYESGYDRIEAIKKALAARHLVVFGTDVSRAFQAGAAGGAGALPPPIGMEMAGGHAMCLAKFKNDEFEGPNSWGRSGDHDGWFRFSADYLAWEKTRDLWIVRYAPPFQKEAA